MPTKSGRIKLEDVRQGKTLWLAFRLNKDEPYKPKPYMVAEGAKLRWAGVKHVEGQAWLSYSLPAYALCPRYSGKDETGQYKSVILSFFHPSRNNSIKELPDGSLVHQRATATRNSCQRLCDELNADFFRVEVVNIPFEQLPKLGAKHRGSAKYQPNFVDPTVPWEEAPAVSGGVPGQS